MYREQCMSVVQRAVNVYGTKSAFVWYRDNSMTVVQIEEQ